MGVHSSTYKTEWEENALGDSSKKKEKREREVRKDRTKDLCLKSTESSVNGQGVN